MKPATQLIIDDLVFYKVHTGHHLVCCAVGRLAQQKPGSNQQPRAPSQEQSHQLPAPQEQPAAASDGLAGMDISAADHPAALATAAAGDQPAAAAGDQPAAAAGDQPAAAAADDQPAAAAGDQPAAAIDDQPSPAAAAIHQQPAVAAQQSVRNKRLRETGITEGEEQPGAREREPAPRKSRKQRKGEADATAEQLDDGQQPAASIDDAGDAPAVLASQSADEPLPDAAAAEHAAVPTAHESEDAGIQDAATAKKLRKEEKKAAKRARREAEEAAADPHTAEVVSEADAPASASAQAAEPAVSQGHPDHPSSSKEAQDAGDEAEGTAAAGPVPQAADGIAACSQPAHQGKCHQATYDVLFVHILQHNLLHSFILDILVFLTLYLFADTDTMKRTRRSSIVSKVFMSVCR